MKIPPLQVESSPFNPQQVELLNHLLPSLTADQMVWLGGYLAALCGRGGGRRVEASTAAAAAGGTAAPAARK